MKKCFDNIKSLDMARMRDHFEATHMNSAEGEKVELKGIVRLEGVVEGWLCDVEDMMRITLKDILRACRLDLKKNLSKREKWVKDWPGQMLITASQMQWTADCEKALDRGDKKGLKSLKKKQVCSFACTCTNIIALKSWDQCIVILKSHEHFYTCRLKCWTNSLRQFVGI